MTTVCIDSLWLPYTQMATASAPLQVAAADGVHIALADGRRLIDGTSSWWTMCHGYNHPHIRSALRAQLDKLPHVMFAGLVHEPALSWRGGSPLCCRPMASVASIAYSFQNRARSPLKWR